MKRSTVVLTILVLCLQVFSGTVVYGAIVEDEILSVDAYRLGEKDIVANDDVDLFLTCTNKSDEEIQNVRVSIYAGSDFGIVGGEPFPILPGLDPHETKECRVTLRYRGTGTYLGMVLEYNDYDGNTKRLDLFYYNIGDVIPTTETPSITPPSSP